MSEPDRGGRGAAGDDRGGGEAAAGAPDRDRGGAAGAHEPGPGLEATIRLQRGPLDIAVDVVARPGEVVALLGPNGAGKSTLLGVVAGLVAPGASRVVLDGRVLDDPAAGVHVPASQRSVGVVFQDLLLFPHLSVVENVAFGLRARGAPKPEARAAAAAWLERMDLAEVADRAPGSLSGGQAQRVALARALATDPRLLLLDEPLSALDAATRTQVRSDLRRHLATFPGARLLVTHDPVDAMVLADRVVVVEAGHVVQEGTVDDISRHPRSAYVAELMGRNLYRGLATRGRVALAGGGVLTVPDDVPDGEVFVSLRPQAVALHRTRPDGTPRNVWSAPVTSIEARADRVRVDVGGAVPVVAEVTPAAVAELGLADGTPVWVAVKATELTVYPA